MNDSAPPRLTISVFADALAEHDCQRGDPGGDLKTVSRRLGISNDYANALLQRLRRKMGLQAK